MFLVEFCPVIRATITEFSSQDVSNSIWSMANIAHQEVSVLQALAGAACSRFQASQATAQDIANSAWALAKLLFVHEPFFQLVAAISEEHLKNFPP